MGLEKAVQGPASGGTIAFADSTGLELVLDDTRHEVLGRFFPPDRGTAFGSDIVILSGVEGSASHQLWEILYLRTHQSRQRFSESIGEMRQAIDGVAPAPQLPRLAARQRTEEGFRFEISGAPGRRARIEHTVDLVRWSSLAEISLGEEPVEWIDRSPPPADEETGLPIPHRFYRAVILP